MSYALPFVASGAQLRAFVEVRVGEIFEGQPGCLAPNVLLDVAWSKDPFGYLYYCRRARGGWYALEVDTPEHPTQSACRAWATTTTARPTRTRTSSATSEKSASSSATFESSSSKGDAPASAASSTIPVHAGELVLVALGVLVVVLLAKGS